MPRSELTDITSRQVGCWIEHRKGHPTDRPETWFAGAHDLHRWQAHPRGLALIDRSSPSADICDLHVTLGDHVRELIGGGAVSKQRSEQRTATPEPGQVEAWSVEGSAFPTIMRRFLAGDLIQRTERHRQFFDEPDLTAEEMIALGEPAELPEWRRGHR